MIGPIRELEGRPLGYDDFRGLLNERGRSFLVVLGAAARDGAIARRADREKVARHPHHAHMNLGLGVIHLVPFGQRRLFAVLGNQLDQLVEFLLIDLLVRPDMRGFWRLRQALDDAVQESRKMPAQRLKADRLPGFFILRPKLNALDRPQPAGHDLLATMTVLNGAIGRDR